jgi:membrane protein implicated in regulation of membrane protease activity
MRTALRFRWQSAALALSAITLAFVVPGIALCKVVPLVSIASAIAITTLIAGLGLYWAGRSIEKRSPQCERVDYYLQASILVIAAALLWFHVILQSGPWRDRSIDPAAALAIVIVCGIFGASLLIRRDRRLAGNGTN